MPLTEACAGMQALVEQCAAAGKVADVERCVLRLDLATLDFNQVTCCPGLLRSSERCRV